MIKALHERLRRGATGDEGISLVEIVVAMMIFAIVSTSLLYGMLAVLALSRDSRAIQVASNLAAEEIDLVRAVEDLFDLVDNTREVELNGDTFSIARTTQWVSDPALELDCGAGGGALRYKRVNVTVTWDNMRSPRSAVETYTVIDPKARINDPAKGTILVSVLGASGEGSPGVSVSASPASPANGAAALTETPSPTDAQGCTYILKVVPGNYNVTVSRTGYVDVEQRTTGTTLVGVEAGSAASVAFQYDRAGSFVVSYATDSPAPGVRIPRDMQTSFLSSYGTFVSAATSASTTRSVSLHPFSGGYSVLAGKYAAPTETTLGCLAVDPAEWPDEVVGGVTYRGSRAGEAAAPPGGSVSTSVPMGTFTLTGAGDRWVKAVSVNRSPACQENVGATYVGMTYVFDRLPNTASATLALPYGSWRLFTGTSTGTQTTVVDANRMIPLTRGSVGADRVMLLDPRVPVVP